MPPISIRTTFLVRVNPNYREHLGGLERLRGSGKGTFTTSEVAFWKLSLELCLHLGRRSITSIHRYLDGLGRLSWEVQTAIFSTLVVCLGSILKMEQKGKPVKMFGTCSEVMRFLEQRKWNVVSEVPLNGRMMAPQHVPRAGLHPEANRRTYFGARRVQGRAPRL